MNTDLDRFTAPVLDASALDAIRALDDDGGDGLLREILAAYFASCPGLLAQMDEGFAASGADKVRIATHTLKSSSANLGAQRLADICKEAESAARAGDLSTALGLAPLIKQVYSQTCEALTRAIAS